MRILSLTTLLAAALLVAAAGPAHGAASLIVRGAASAMASA